jgi:hemoglobin-like flavoprotein
MTNKQIQLVQQSWEWVKPMAKQAGLNFYENLFEAAPGIRHLFKSDIQEQAGKLVTILGYVVAKLDRLDLILSDVEKLGERHNSYGARPEHYDVVGNCLIQTLSEGLGDKWTDETEKAWILAFSTVKTAMITAQQSQKEVANYSI